MIVTGTRDGWCAVQAERRKTVIPAKAGIQKVLRDAPFNWIPVRPRAVTLVAGDDRLSFL